MTKENIYYMDDNAFDRFYKRARYQANSFVAGKLGSTAADYLTTLPDFAYLVCKLMLDPDVPSSRKLDLGLALLYVLSPLDFVPDSFPLLGKIDDVYAILVSVAKLLRSTDRNIILRHWLGDPETIDTVRAWLNYFDEKFRPHEKDCRHGQARLRKFVKTPVIRSDDGRFAFPVTFRTSQTRPAASRNSASV